MNFVKIFLIALISVFGANANCVDMCEMLGKSRGYCDKTCKGLRVSQPERNGYNTHCVEMCKSLGKSNCEAQC